MITKDGNIKKTIALIAKQTQDGSRPVPMNMDMDDEQYFKSGTKNVCSLQPHKTTSRQPKTTPIASPRATQEIKPLIGRLFIPNGGDARNRTGVQKVEYRPCTILVHFEISVAGIKSGQKVPTTQAQN